VKFWGKKFKIFRQTKKGYSEFCFTLTGKIFLVARISFGGLENLPVNVKKLRCLFAKKSPKLCAGEIRKIITTLSI
jgi:hypothetical protein